MTGFEYNVPLKIPSLTEQERQDLQVFYEFYNQHIDAMNTWAEKELIDHPAFGRIIKETPPEALEAQRAESRRCQEDAIFRDNWEPYLKHLGLFGVLYAQMGLDFHSWFDVVGMIRRYLTPHLLQEASNTSIIAIMNGMDKFMDIAMSGIGEAYLFEKRSIIEKQKQEQEILIKELEQFSYIASHDLQEPLNTVSSFVNLLEEEYGAHFPSEAAEYLSYIKGSTRRMTELITGLLEYSRVGKNREFKQTSIESLVREVMEDMKVRIDKSNARIEILTSLPTLPVSPVEIKVLFQNLLSNAIKFQKKEQTPLVKIKAQREYNHWHFTIEDNGIGIEAKDLDKLFVIFKRLHNTRDYEGTGIGLAHCKKIVELHGGQMWVESMTNEGTTFHFTLTDKQPGE